MTDILVGMENIFNENMYLIFRLFTFQLQDLINLVPEFAVRFVLTRAYIDCLGNFTVNGFQRGMGTAKFQERRFATGNGFANVLS